MSILAIISYPDQGSAGEAVAALKRRQKEFLIELEDVAWVTRSQDGRMKLRQGTCLTGAGSASSAFWGFLFGLFFLVANRGMDAGSAMSAAAGVSDRLWVRRQVGQDDGERDPRGWVGALRDGAQRQPGAGAPRDGQARRNAAPHPPDAQAAASA